MKTDLRYRNLTVQGKYEDYLYFKNEYLLGEITRNQFGHECIFLFDELMERKNTKGCDDIIFYKEAMDLMEIMSTYMFYISE